MFMIFKMCFILLQAVLGERASTADGTDDLIDLPEITDADLLEMKYIKQILEEASR